MNRSESSNPVKPYKYKLTPRDPKCSKCYITMVQIKDLVKGWQWVCLKCGLRHNIPQNTYTLGKDDKE